MPAKKTYLFYDTETTGLNLCFDQVMQFASIRTDENFNELERHEIFIKINPDVIPNPHAILTHLICPQFCQDKGLTEDIAIRKIHKLLNTPNTISIGYNTLGFDDELLRFSFYRNLLPPYTHQYANGCSRMDLYPMAAMYHLFKSDILKWPTKDNKISLKLELLSKENQLATGQAHNAIVDVEATIALAKKFREDPAIWQYVSDYFNKQKDSKRLQELTECMTVDNTIYYEALMINGIFGSDNFFQVPVMTLGQHHFYKNQTMWLRLDQKDLSKTTIDNVFETTYCIKKKLTEPPFILPTKPRFLKHLSEERKNLANQNLKWLKDNPKILKAIEDYYRNFQYPEVPNIDIDAALYTTGFPSNHDVSLSDKFHKGDIKQKLEIVDMFESQNRREQALRLLSRHYPDKLNSDLLESFNGHVAKIYSDKADGLSNDYRHKAHYHYSGFLEDLKTCEEKATDEMRTELLKSLTKLVAERRD